MRVIKASVDPGSLTETRGGDAAITSDTFPRYPSG